MHLVYPAEGNERTRPDANLLRENVPDASKSLDSSLRRHGRHTTRTMMRETMFFYSPGGKALINDPETEKPLIGVVLSGAHGIYDVHTDDGILRCTLRGKLKKAFAQAQSSKSIHKVRPRQDKLLTTTTRTERMERRNSSESPQRSEERRVGKESTDRW